VPQQLQAASFLTIAMLRVYLEADVTVLRSVKVASNLQNRFSQNSSRHRVTGLTSFMKHRGS